MCAAGCVPDVFAASNAFNVADSPGLLGVILSAREFVFPADGAAMSSLVAKGTAECVSGEVFPEWGV